MSNMPTFLAFIPANFDCPLFYERNLIHIRIVINKIINKNRVKREWYYKIFLGGKTMYYNEETLFCLILETAVLY